MPDGRVVHGRADASGWPIVSVPAADIAAARQAALARELRIFLHKFATDGGGVLLQEHRNDGTGHCRVCSSGGQTGRITWPCQLYGAAQAAVAGRPATCSPAMLPRLPR